MLHRDFSQHGRLGTVHSPLGRLPELGREIGSRSVWRPVPSVTHNVASISLQTSGCSAVRTQPSGQVTHPPLPRSHWTGCPCAMPGSSHSQSRASATFPGTSRGTWPARNSGFQPRDPRPSNQSLFNLGSFPPHFSLSWPRSVCQPEFPLLLHPSWLFTSLCSPGQDPRIYSSLRTPCPPPTPCLSREYLASSSVQLTHPAFNFLA